MGLARDLLDVLLPTPCAACGALAGDGDLVRLCASCEAQLPRHPWPLAGDIPGITTGWYLAPYDGVAGELVRRGKYDLREELLAELCELAARGASGRLPEVDLVVPVPSPVARRLLRGFSLPDMLASALAEGLGTPRSKLLSRRGGPRQARVDRAARWENVQGVMRLAGSPPPGSRVLLVDDVVTSGATAAACAQVMLLAGVREVHLFTFASALR